MGGKPAAQHLRKGWSSSALLGPQKLRKSRISGVIVNAHVLVAAVSVSWTLAASSHSCRMRFKRIARYTKDPDVTESMQQRERLESVWRLPAVQKHVAASSNADTKGHKAHFIEQPTHWTKPLAAVVLLFICSHLFMNVCMAVTDGHQDSDTALHTLARLIALRQLLQMLRRLRR